MFFHKLLTFSSKKKYPHSARVLILIATLIFYGIESPWWLIPFTLSLLIDYTLAYCISVSANPKLRKALVVTSVVQLLCLLSVFKYWNFIGKFLASISPMLFAHYPKIELDGAPLPLPAGISFYIFESLSFVIDVYRRDVVLPRNPLKFLGFIMMFPRFIAGPIVRYKDMEKQYESYSGMQIEKGLFLFSVGFFLKSCFADQFAVFTDNAFGRPELLSFFSAWIGVFSYTLQIYFDFSGYSLMAIGLGFCLGFQFPANFNRPYLSDSLQNFWRRWHISLSTWLRDYLYISLGGSQRGTLRTYLNLFLTMLVGGLWHGAGSGFVIWGAWHGTFLCLERFFNFPTRRLNPALAKVSTFMVVMFGWVFFKANGVKHALTIFKHMLNPMTARISDFACFETHSLSFFACVLGVYYCFSIEKSFDIEKYLEKTLVPLKYRFFALLQLVFSLLIAFSSNKLPFLYFQF